VVTLEPGVTQARLHEFLCDGKYPYLVPVTGAGPNCSIVGNAIERGYGITPWVDHRRPPRPVPPIGAIHATSDRRAC
jgi:hypothetical protein